MNRLFLPSPFGPASWLRRGAGLSFALGLLMEAAGAAETEPGDRTLFFQDFSQSPKVEAYIGSGDNRLDDISPPPAQGSWSITEDGKLRLELAGEGDEPAGIARTTDLPGEPTALLIAFDFLFESVPPTWSGDPITLDIGGWAGEPSAAPYGKFLRSTQVFERMEIRAYGAGSFHVRFAGRASRNLPADQPHSVLLALNNSGQDVTYTGPDHNTHTLAHQDVALWVDEVLIGEHGPRRAGSKGDRLVNFRFSFGCPEPVTIVLDNLKITDLSPP